LTEVNCTPRRFHPAKWVMRIVFRHLLSRVDLALEKLMGLKPLVEPRLLKAGIASIVHDQQVCLVEMELLRAFPDVLDCPMPPVSQWSFA